ncbi:MAG: hypothetical protein V4507_01110, partial [Verrucomicrobiota bacterium]
ERDRDPRSLLINSYCMKWDKPKSCIGNLKSGGANPAHAGAALTLRGNRSLAAHRLALPFYSPKSFVF